MPLDQWDIEHGSVDPNAEGDVDWNAVEGLVGLALKAREEKIRAEQNAIRFAGHQEYQSLVAGGMSPEEALRKTAGKLYFNSPEHLTAALRYSKPPPVIPTQLQAVPIIGPEGKAVGMGIPNPRGGVHLVTQPRTATTSNRLTPEQQREANLAGRELSAAQTGLNTATAALAKLKSSRIYKKSDAQQLEQQVADYTQKLEAAKQRYRTAGFSPDAMGTNAPIAAPTARQARPLPASKDQLEANITYQTPKGEFTWTGTGWIKAESSLPLLPIGAIDEEDAGDE